jgi:hypothetical protein
MHYDRGGLGDVGPARLSSRDGLPPDLAGCALSALP